MRLYRLCDKKYAEDLSGLGAKLFGGRWNEVDTACIYTSQHLSLAFLEKFVHANAKENMMNIALLEFEIPDDENIIFNVDQDKLDVKWMNDVAYTQWLGSQILSDDSILAFSMPSALIPQERNYVLNPNSNHFDKLKIVQIADFKTDYRLLSKLI
ncbi:MAG: RES domain-containing protein [Chitinophagaceae bacterium]|nr:MAG: RES domain-containing protein [Chitinophagaceae bacterium]